MTVFWCKGYEATSIQNLVDHMGVQRGSLYAAFGDKHNLFVEALRHYAQTVISRHLRLLEEPTEGLSAIRKFFDEIVEISIQDGDAKGCFITNTMAELAASDEVVAAELRTAVDALEARFQVVLEQAQRQGEIAPEKDPKALSHFLVSSLHGLRITAKLYRDRTHLEAVKNTFLGML